MEAILKVSRRHRQMFPTKHYNSQRCSIEKVFLKFLKKLPENTIVAVSLQLHSKETTAQVFSHEFCQIFQNTFLLEQVRESTNNYAFCLYN